MTFICDGNDIEPKFLQQENEYSPIYETAFGINILENVHP